MKPLVTSFAWFALAGAIGFAVDALIVTILMRHAGWAPVYARAVSFPTAVAVTWLINRTLAFAGRVRPHAAKEATAYFAIQSIGAAINLGVFLLCLLIWPPLRAIPALPLAAGAVLSLVFNFTVARGALYSPRRDAACERTQSQAPPQG